MSAGSPLVLGGVVFEDFEVPDSLKFGTKQRHHVHKLLGGGRVIQTQGPDPDDRKWSGRFRGANAESRARQLDEMASSGAEIGLSFGSFFCLCILSHFEADYKRPYEIPYTCTVTVSESDGGGFLGLLGSLAMVLAGDIGQIVNMISGVQMASVNGAGAILDDVAAILDPVTSLDQLPAASMAAVRSGLALAADDLGQQKSALGSMLGQVDLRLPALGGLAVDVADKLAIEFKVARDLATVAAAHDVANRAAQAAAGAA